MLCLLFSMAYLFMTMSNSLMRIRYYKLLSIFSHAIKLSTIFSFVLLIYSLSLWIIFYKLLLTFWMLSFWISTYLFTLSFNEAKLINNSLVYFILMSNRSNFCPTNLFSSSINLLTSSNVLSCTSNLLSTSLNMPISNILGSLVTIMVS